MGEPLSSLRSASRNSSCISQPGRPGGLGFADLPKQFSASIDLDPVQAKKQFADVVDEVIQQFTARAGVQVRISVEIDAQSPTAFDDGLQRAVRENCNVLRFRSAEFEAGE